MFKGFKEFTYKMIAGANVATIIIMLLVGFLTSFSQKSSPHWLILVYFPGFLIVNLGFCFSGCSSGLSMPLFHS